MPFHLDTNIAIHARDGSERVSRRMAEHAGQIFMSALTLAELQKGLVSTASEFELRRARLLLLLSSIPILPFDVEAAEAYGRILERCGWVRGRAFDRMIAAHAISAGATLVTNNLADFRDIPGVALEDWTEA